MDNQTVTLDRDLCEKVLRIAERNTNAVREMAIINSINELEIECNKELAVIEAARKGVG